jgi:hypothetical protein
MRVNVEVPIIGWGQIKSGQAYKDIFASVPRVFDIPEYDLSEVPVVLAYGLAHSNGTNSRVEYFGSGGKLYTDRVVAPDEDGARLLRYQRYGGPVHPYFAAISEKIGTTIHRLRKESESLLPKRTIPSAFGDFLVKGRFDDEFVFPALEELRLKSYGEERVEAQLAEFAKRMERMIIVGGNLFVQEQEPIIRFEGDIGSFSARVSGRVQDRPEPVRLVDIEGWYGTSPLGFVSLADFESLPARIAAIEETGKSVEFETGIFDVEIDDGRYLRSSSEATTLTAVADMMRRTFTEKMYPHGDRNDSGKKRMQGNLLELDPKLLVIMQKLVVGLHQATETDVPAELEEAVAAVVRHHAAGQDIGFCDKRLIAYASDVLQLWNDRGVEFEIAPQPMRLIG